MVNLLFIITELELGGAQKHLLSLIDNLDKNKYRIFLFTSKKGLLLPKITGKKEIILKKSSFLCREINPIKDLAALIEIYLFIKNNNILIVHTHSSKAGILGRFAAKLAKIKIIIHTIHGWSFNDFQHPFIRKLYICLEKLAAEFSHKLIAVSNYDKQKGLENKIGKNTQYQIIYYGINFNEFKQNKLCFRAGSAAESNNTVLRVGTISCLKPQKCPEDFIKLAHLTLQQIPNAQFILAGDGKLLNKINREIKKFKLEKNILLLGWRNDIPEILSNIDVFVLTSLWEGLPISVLEAILMSKPVIVTDTGGIRDVITEGKNGFLVKRRDITNMAEKLVELLRNAPLRKTIGENAVNSLSHRFKLSSMITNTQNLYDELLNEKL